jgi:peroxiredoxin
MNTKIFTTLLFATLTTFAFAESDLTPLKVGDSAPDVSVKTENNEVVKLKKFISEKPTVLIFYRGGWCPFCNQHLQALAGIEKDVEEAGAQIIALSSDQPKKLLETPDREKLHYLLLSDCDTVAANGFGIAFKVDDATVEKYKTYKIDLNEASGRDHHILPHPAVFITSTNGLIRFAHVNPDYKERLDPKEILKSLRSIKE